MLFAKLHDLALQGPLVLSLTADPVSGKMTITVTPMVDKDIPEKALRQPLTLSATPAEFDAEFFDVLDKYSAARQSLREQAAATVEVLAAAKMAQVDRASKATAKSAKPQPAPNPTATPAGVLDDDPDDDTNAAQGSGTGTATGESTSDDGVSLFD